MADDSEGLSQGGQGDSGGGPPRLPPQLVRKYDHMLKKRAGRLPRLTKEQAEDLVGNVWLYAFRNLDKVCHHPNPGAWLYRVLAHQYIDFCRSPKQVPFEQAYLATLAEEDQRFGRYERHEMLKLAIQALPPQLAEAIMLRLEGLTLEQIGQRLQISTAEAGRRVGRAYRELSEFIKKDRH